MLASIILRPTRVCRDPSPAQTCHDHVVRSRMPSLLQQWYGTSTEPSVPSVGRAGGGAMVAAIVCWLATASAAAGDDAAAAARARAFDAAYNLDHERALSLFAEALATAPDDAAAHRGVATVQWLEIIFGRGTITVEEFLGDTRPTGNLPQPPPERARAFHEHARRALELAEARLARAPLDPEAHYQVGAAAGLLASYTATVDGRFVGAFKWARRAFDEHERVLELNPQRHDAALTVGAYRYVISTLWAPTRMLAYLAGFGGGRERGLALVESAARYRSDAQAEAKLALVLLYNRERRYADALRVLADLRGRFPRNRLFWLESGATALRAGLAKEAQTLIADGMARFSSDTRPRAFGEMALWHYVHGAALLERGDLPGARRSLTQALDGDARTWVRGRTHLALGRVLEASNDRAGARTAYDTAARLAEAGRDPAAAAEARRRRSRLPR
jgi:tetratricopeptide (TPR) repeat protein